MKLNMESWHRSFWYGFIFVELILLIIVGILRFEPESSPDTHKIHLAEPQILTANILPEKPILDNDVEEQNEPSEIFDNFPITEEKSLEEEVDHIILQKDKNELTKQIQLEDNIQEEVQEEVQKLTEETTQEKHEKLVELVPQTVENTTTQTLETSNDDIKESKPLTAVNDVEPKPSEQAKLKDNEYAMNVKPEDVQSHEKKLSKQSSSTAIKTKLNIKVIKNINGELWNHNMYWSVYSINDLNDISTVLYKVSKNNPATFEIQPGSYYLQLNLLCKKYFFKINLEANKKYDEVILIKQIIKKTKKCR